VIKNILNHIDEHHKKIGHIIWKEVKKCKKIKEKIRWRVFENWKQYGSIGVELET